MTLDELKAEAKAHGYRLSKIPEYTCICNCPYPRTAKCARYEPVPVAKRSTMTHCRKKEVSDTTSAQLYTSQRQSPDGTVEVLGYAYGDPWVAQALLMDDMKFDTPEEAKEWWEKNYGKA